MKKMYLTAIFGNHTRIVAEGIASLMQKKKKEFKGQQQWKGWTFDIRNPEAYKACPIRKKKDALIA